MRLSIITINFRKPLLTLACIDSLYTTYKNNFEKNEWELLVVDNLSGDESLHILEKEIQKKKYANVHLLAHTENNGFGGGNNFGASHAKGEYLLFLNNDTIVKKGIKEMVSYLEKNPHIGILGGPLQNLNGTIQSSAGKFYTPFRVFLLLLGLQRFGLDKSPENTEKVDWVKGALLLIRKKLFQELQGFDEGIFMYTEDMELCYRAYAHKKDVYFFPDVIVVHADMGSSNRTFAIVSIYTGILYFYKKHKSIVEYRMVKLLLQTKALLLVLLGKLLGNTYLIATYEKAFNVAR